MMSFKCTYHEKFNSNISSGSWSSFSEFLRQHFKDH